MLIYKIRTCKIIIKQLIQNVLFLISLFKKNEQIINKTMKVKKLYVFLNVF